MEIRGGKYTFQGEESDTGIVGRIGPASAANQTGALTMLAGTLTLNLATDFENGTEFHGGTIVLGHDRALGSHTGSGNAGLVTVPSPVPGNASAGNSTIRTLEDRTITNRFRVGPQRALIFDIAAGTTLTIAGVDAGTDDGGVFRLEDNASLVSHLNKGNLIVSESRAQNGGAIHAGTNTTVNMSSLKNVSFLRNSAFENGGAVRALGGIRFGDHARFENNAAGTDGGALHVDGPLEFGDNTTFLYNTAIAGSGGAINAAGDLTVRGNTVFDGNASGQWGGAVFMAGGTDVDDVKTLTLDATVRIVAPETPDVTEELAGDIVFTGNRQHADFTPEGTLVEGSGRANAVRLQHYTDLVLSGKGNIFFNDSLEADVASTGNTLHKSGEGFVQFLGDNTLNADGSGGTVTIAEGTMRIAAGATFTTLGDDAVFTLAGRKTPARDNGSLYGGTLAGGGTITAGNGFVLGGVVSADNAVFDHNDPEHPIAPGEMIGTLTLVGDVRLDGATLAVDLDREGAEHVSDLVDVKGDVTFGPRQNAVDIGRWMNGTFDILKADSIEDIYTDTVVDGKEYRVNERFGKITVGGNELGSRQIAKMELNDDKTTLQLITESQNMGLVWTGKTNRSWNTTDHNWVSAAGGADELFNQGDHVLFNGLGQGAIVISGTAMSTAGMAITAGSYEFSGGAILGNISTGRFNSDGKLTVSDAEVVFNTDVDFEGGITADSGAQVGLFGQNGFATAGELLFKPGSLLVFDASDNKFKGRSISFEGDVVVTNALNLVPGTTKRYVNVLEATDVDLDRIRLTDLFTRTIALWGQTADFTSNRTMDLVYDKITIGQYGMLNGISWNMNEVAQSLNETFKGNEMSELHEMFLGCATNEEVDAILDQLRGAEIVADAMTLPFWKPWRTVFRMVDRQEGREEISPVRVFRGQAARRVDARNLWFDAYHSDLDADSDGNARRYGISRTGMVLGGDVRLNSRTTVGLMFGYGRPKLYGEQRGQVEAEDYTFGVFIKSYWNWGIESYGYIGIGHQGYESERDVLGGHSRGEYEGDSYYMAGRLVKPYVMNHFLTLLPTLGFDVQTMSTSGFAESDGKYGQRISGNDLQRSMFNLGLNSHWRVNDWATIDGRLLYGRQIVGESHGDVDARFLAAPGGPAMNLRGVDLGPDTFNVGIGGQAYLNNKRSTLLFGDYDYDAGSRNFSSTVQLGITSMW